MGRPSILNASALRALVLAEADGEAGAAVEEAEAKAAEQVRRARREAAALLLRARREGERAGELETAALRAEARGHARRLVLEARREVYEELCRRAQAAALELRESEAYGALLERLEAAARAQLGPEAEVEIDVPELGGVRARAGTRRVDYTLPALTERCITALGGELERLWR